MARVSTAVRSPRGAGFTAAAVVAIAIAVRRRLLFLVSDPYACTSNDRTNCAKT